MNRSRDGDFGFFASYFRTSSYRTRRISTSEKAAPTWPRCPAASVLMIVRRSALERSSSLIVSGSVIYLYEERIDPVLGAKAIDERGGLAKLRGPHLRRRRRLTIRQTVVQQNKAPFQAKERIDEAGR